MAELKTVRAQAGGSLPTNWRRRVHRKNSLSKTAVQLRRESCCRKGWFASPRFVSTHCFAFAERSSPHELKTIALRKGHDGATCTQANVRAAQAGRRCSEGFELCGGGGRCTGCGSCCGGSATRHAEPRRRKCRHCRRRRRSAIQGRAGQASIQFCPGARAHHRPRLFGCAQQCCARGWRICPHAQAGLRSGKLPEESAARIQQLLLRASRTGNASFFPPFLRPVGRLDSC